VKSSTQAHWGTSISTAHTVVWQAACAYVSWYILNLILLRPWDLDLIYQLRQAMLTEGRCKNCFLSPWKISCPIPYLLHTTLHT